MVKVSTDEVQHRAVALPCGEAAASSSGAIVAVRRLMKRRETGGTETSLAAAVRRIEDSFPEAMLQPETAFGGSGTTYLNAGDFISGARGKTWRMLEPSFLEHHHDALLFLTSEAFVAYLPAYLVAWAHGGPEIRNLPAFLRGVLTRTRDPQWFDARFGRLSEIQQRAIARLLVELESAISSRLDKEEMAEVVDSHWRELVSKDEV